MLTEADVLESGDKPEAPPKQENKRVRRARDRKRLNSRKCFDCTHKFMNHRAMNPAGAWCYECNEKCAGQWEIN